VPADEVAADLLPVEVRGTFLQRVTAELRGAGTSATSTSNRRCARRCSIAGTISLRTRLRGQPAVCSPVERDGQSAETAPYNAPRRARGRAADISPPIRKQRGNAKPAENWKRLRKAKSSRCS